MRDSAKRVRLSAWLRGDGIEIGALHNPLPVPPGANARYVDHLPEAELRKHYPELDGQRFAPVSIIGSAYDLSMLADGSLDFVIANHLIEHLEDPIAAFKEFERVLRLGGVLYLALPDKRRTFDRRRELTPIQHLFAEHRSGAAANRAGHYLEWALLVDGRDEAHATTLLERRYSIHFHVWRSDTFLDFLIAARQEFDLDFEIVQFAGLETDDDDECILILVKGRGEQVTLPPGPLPPSANGHELSLVPIRHRGVLARAKAILARLQGAS